MIKFENTEVMGWEAAIRGMRNPMNSWEKSDSFTCETCKHDIPGYDITMREECGGCCSWNNKYESDGTLKLGPNDLDLMRRLAAGGPVHAKYRRMITVYVDITAPLYWWKEFDTYKVGTVANSCSTMHKIAAKEFTIDDFSHEHLNGVSRDMFMQNDKDQPYFFCSFEDMLYIQVEALNRARKLYIETKDKKYWWQMIQLLPSSYNQKRTVMMNYEVLAGIYPMRKNHKLDEWAEHNFDGSLADYLKERGSDALNQHPYGFCDWIKTLPYSELITGQFNETNDSEVAK